MHMDFHVLLEKRGRSLHDENVSFGTGGPGWAVANSKVFGEIHRRFVYAQGVNEVITVVTNTSIYN